jgi:hypothetical protein
MRFVLAAALLAWAGAAAADLYRWVDPDSGSVKFSNYPPPWYGDQGKDQRAPKVEVIPERRVAPPIDSWKERTEGSRTEGERKPDAGRAPGTETKRENPGT